MTAENEAWYDANVAPVLAQLAQQCADRSMNFHATVEIDPGVFGSTTMMPKPNIAIQMVFLADRSLGNVDTFSINLLRWCQQNDVDTSASIFLRRFTQGATT